MTTLSQALGGRNRRRKESVRALVLDSFDPRTIEVTGSRFCQTLRALIAAGDKGITALEMSSWAFRLGHYVFILRRDYGLLIDMQHEAHDGGFHGRYRLQCKVEILDGGQDRAAA